MNEVVDPEEESRLQRTPIDQPRGGEKRQRGREQLRPSEPDLVDQERSRDRQEQREPAARSPARRRVSVQSERNAVVAKTIIARRWLA
jgi:hypothetical protein